ncbi:MAG: sulfatase-like hydrolase/transferase [Phycisphaerales bacterium]|nr:sulfatase-like hydrolase/transferase [Phycisphaerales bacterium]
MRKFLVNFCVGCATASVLLAPHLRMYNAEATRYFTYWGRSDALALTILIVGIGALLATLHMLARAMRNNAVDRIADAAFVALLGIGLVVTVRSGLLSTPQKWQAVFAASAVGVILLGVACLHWRMRAVPRAARALCLILSPAVVVVIGQMLAYPEFSVPREPDPSTQQMPVVAALTGGHPQPVPSGNVYLFVFDEWSYERTFTEDMATELPNLAELTADATVYHDAHSSFHETRLSLPSILFQTDETYTWAGGEPGFQTADGNSRDARLRSNVFSRMKTLGYHTYMVGFYHPYRRLFGAELDNCFAAADRRGDNDERLNGNDLLRHLRCASWVFAMALPKPDALAWRVHRWCGAQEATPRRDRVSQVHERALAIMRQPAPTFAVLHYPLPHDPLIFDRDGAHEELGRTLPMDFGPYGADGFVRPRPENQIARYAGNLRYLDTVLGELMATLRAAGNFEDATIILTSDHTWRFDPELDQLYIERGLPYRSLAFENSPAELTHVPLVIRHPHQQERVDVDATVRLTDLMQMLDLNAEPVDSHYASR